MAARLSNVKKSSGATVGAGTKTAGQVLANGSGSKKTATRSQETDERARVAVSKAKKEISVLEKVKKQSKPILTARIENSIRCVSIQDNETANFAVQNIANLIVGILKAVPPTGSGAAFRGAGSAATQLQLENVELSARALAHDIDSLNEPAALILASIGLADRYALLSFINRIEQKAKKAKDRVLNAKRAGKTIPPVRGRRVEPLPSAVARMVAHYFKAMVGSEPNADGRGSQFVTMLGSVLKAAGIEGNARYYAAKAVSGREIP